jgi:hypothetical protein
MDVAREVGLFIYRYCRQLIATSQDNLLDFLEKVCYNNNMARPKKDPAMRMDTDIRIPVTEEQKRLIQDAVADDPAGMAAWARIVLLHAARRKIAEKGKASHKNL